MKSLALLLFTWPYLSWAAAYTIDCGSASDAFFTGGYVWTAAPPPDTTLRYGAFFSYQIPAAGLNTVRLYFEEPNQTTIGARVFSVSINGVVALDKLDLVADGIFAAAGAHGPYYWSFPASAPGGFVVIDFSSSTPLHGAVVSSIEVAPVAPLSPFADAEIPAGAMDGVNVSYSLAAAPSPPLSLLLTLNGVVLRQGVDYQLAGAAVSLLPQWAPAKGDVLQAWYRR